MDRWTHIYFINTYGKITLLFEFVHFMEDEQTRENNLGMFLHVVLFLWFMMTYITYIRRARSMSISLRSPEHPFFIAV